MLAKTVERSRIIYLAAIAKMSSSCSQLQAADNGLDSFKVDVQDLKC